MKKVYLFIILLSSITSFAQLSTKQIAFGAKGIDSISGVTTKYYYFNFIGTKVPGLVKSTTSNTLYEILSAQVSVVHPLVYTASDSIDLTWETSLDNVNWVKITNAGATSPITQTSWENGGPQIIGSNASYLYDSDLVRVRNTNAVIVWQFHNRSMFYLRLRCDRYKASSASYVQAIVLYKRVY